MPHPTPEDQRAPLSGPAFAPDERLRSTQVEHFNHWQDLVDKRLIGTIEELSRKRRAAIVATERALGVGQARKR